MNQINISKLVLGPIRTNCYLVHKENTKECMIIDPADQPDRIITAINDELLEPVAILLTHGHYDHIGAVEAVKRQFHVPVYAGSEEKEVLRNSYNNLSELMGEHPFIIDATDYLEDMQKLFLAGLNITALATPVIQRVVCLILFPVTGNRYCSVEIPYFREVLEDMIFRPQTEGHCLIPLKTNCYRLR